MKTSDVIGAMKPAEPLYLFGLMPKPPDETNNARILRSHIKSVSQGLIAKAVMLWMKENKGGKPEQEAMLKYTGKNSKAIKELLALANEINPREVQKED